MDRDIFAANGVPGNGNGDEDGTGLGLATKTRTRTKSPTQRLMGNLPASISGSTPSITTRRCVPTVRLIKMAGVSNNPSSKCGMSGKMAGLAGGMRESGFRPP